MPDIPSVRNDGFLKAGGDALAYTLLQAPIDSLNQIVKHSVGTENLVDLHIASTPQPQKANSTGEIGQAIGGFVGTLPYFALANRFGVGAVAKVARYETAESLPVLARMAGAAAGGVAYDAVMRPVAASDENNFWKIKGAGAASAAITFGTMEGIAGGMKKGMDAIMPSLADDKNTFLADQIARKTIPSIFSGYIGGYVATDSYASLSGKPVVRDELDRELHKNKNLYPALTFAAAVINFKPLKYEAYRP